MVWDASAGAVRASYWRTTVDEDGHYCFAAASDSPHRTLMRRNNADARKGWMRLLRRRWYRVFAPEVDPPCLRASPVREAWPRRLRPYHRLLQNGTIVR